MIYTKNIQKTVKRIEEQLNKELGTSTNQNFYVSASEEILEINVYWCLSINDLLKVKEIIGSDFYISRSIDHFYSFTIWTTIGS